VQWSIRLRDGEIDHAWVIQADLGFVATDYERRNRGMLVVRAKAGDFVTLDAHRRVQVPRHVSAEYLNDETGRAPLEPREAPLFTDTYEIQSLDQKPKDKSLFSISDDRPGVTIADGTLPEAAALPGKRVQYTIPPNPADLDAAIKAAKKGIDWRATAPTGPDPNQSRLIVILALNAGIIVVLGLVATVLIRQRRRQE
jgi:hypothetical protein